MVLREVRVEHVSEFKHLECVFDEAGTNEAVCSRKVASGRRVASAIMSLVDARDCRLSMLVSCMKHCMYLFI